MVFKKYHCAKCGTKLKNEKTHRVVTKDDRDYYQYHDLGTFPHRDYDVYEYRFACPKCGARVSFDEQRIIAGIQNIIFFMSYPFFLWLVCNRFGLFFGFFFVVDYGRRYNLFIIRCAE